MATTVRVATFNCENLFARYKFKEGIDVKRISEEGWDINRTSFEPLDPVTRRITGNAIDALNADVIALQEVENLDVLKRFRSKYLGGSKAYPYLVLVDANDPRLIDVAVMSRHPIIHVRSHQERKESPRKRGFIFSRDCLELDISFRGGGTITLFVNHLKSMMEGRARTRPRREIQAAAVKEIVKERFGPNPGQNPFMILGDLNDYLETDANGPSGILEIAGWDQVENVVGRLPADERWTHYYDDGDEYRQLDYILVSQALRQKVKNLEIERRGLPLRAQRYGGPRFRGVGKHSPKASDHCAVVVELEV